MRNFDEATLTDAVLRSLDGAPGARARDISGALVRNLHAFIREIQPTHAEWAAAIDFLTRTGAMCSPTRQEFILLSDVLGASMLVDAINHPLPGDATQTTVLAPFYVEDPPEITNGSKLASRSEGEPLHVTGAVRTLSGAPIADAVVDTWHSDAEGFYDVQHPQGAANPTLRARLHTDAQGRFDFRTIVPSFYPIPTDGPVGAMLEAQGRHPYRPAHIHFIIGAPGFRTLVTHIFLAGDPYLDSDVVFGVKDSLIRALEPPSDGGPAKLCYDFVLAEAD